MRLTRGINIVVGIWVAGFSIWGSTLYLGDIVHVVLEEADRMLDIGFRPDIERILRKLPQPRSNNASCRLRSMRMSGNRAHRYMFEPFEVNSSSQDEPSFDTIQHGLVSVNTDQEIRSAAAQLGKRDWLRQWIVFTRTSWRG